MTQRTLIKELKTESLILGKGYLFEVAQGIYYDKRKRTFIKKQEVEKVKEKVALFTGIAPSQMFEVTRKQDIVKAKYIAISECVRLNLGTNGLIAQEFGLCNHTMVNYACESVQNQYEKYPKYRALVDKIRNS